MRRSGPVEIPAQFCKLPFDSVEHRQPSGHCSEQRGLLAGFARVNNLPQATAFPRALGPMPCARRERFERKRAASRRIP